MASKGVAAGLAVAFFLVPVGAFLTSYLFVLRSAPGAALLTNFLGPVSAPFLLVSWVIHFFLTQLFLVPIALVFPQYFIKTSKVVGMVPEPMAFFIGGVIYAAVATVLFVFLRNVRFKGSAAG